MADVFISYHVASAAATVRQICEQLDKRGITYWYSETGVSAGESFARIIPRQIKMCKVCLWILDQGAAESKHVEREIMLADKAEDVKIIPFCLESIRLNPQSEWTEYYLANIQKMDARTPPLDRRIKELVNLIEEILRERREAAEAEREALEGAEREAREVAERKAREEAERKAREAAEREARKEAKRKTREEAVWKKVMGKISSLSDINPATLYRIVTNRLNPSRNILLRLALEMDLTLDETQILLQSKNCAALSADRPRDIVIMDAISHKRGVDGTNQDLENYDFPGLN